MKLKAFLKEKGITVTVVSVNFEHRYILWWDGQYDRCCPPNKLYEQELFDNIGFENATIRELVM